MVVGSVGTNLKCRTADGVSDGEKRRGGGGGGAVTFRFACAHQEGRFLREERQLAAVGRGRSGAGGQSAVFPSGEKFPLTGWTQGRKERSRRTNDVTGK